jgi:hypothetical protein
MLKENGIQNITKIKREYINQNLNIFLDYYSIIEDEKFKEFAALICYEFNYYNEEILNYYLKNGVD